ncbi:hypothetical protein [Methanosarcina acetivorans]|nr:hypothetical protein [Methanosarcina acetivorans]
MFVQNSNYGEHISFIEHFHSDFYKTVESYAGNSRVYVFVDDPDRRIYYLGFRVLRDL